MNRLLLQRDVLASLLVLILFASLHARRARVEGSGRWCSFRQLPLSAKASKECLAVGQSLALVRAALCLALARLTSSVVTSKQRS
jgi:hypothetical protein